jgi:hypothetical protein
VIDRALGYFFGRSIPYTGRPLTGALFIFFSWMVTSSVWTTNLTPASLISCDVFVFKLGHNSSIMGDGSRSPYARSREERTLVNLSVLYAARMVILDLVNRPYRVWYFLTESRLALSKAAMAISGSFGRPNYGWLSIFFLYLYTYFKVNFLCVRCYIVWRWRKNYRTTNDTTSSPHLSFPTIMNRAVMPGWKTLWRLRSVLRAKGAFRHAGILHILFHLSSIIADHTRW